MLADSDLRPFFDSLRTRRFGPGGDHPTAPAALPDSALDFLVNLARDLRASSIFEFGSGRSTAAFLRAGFSVISLENSTHWMEQTIAPLSDAERSRHTAVVRPLRFKLHGTKPMMDWVIDPPLARMLAGADLILVDSPYYPPFREATIWSALRHNDHAVVVLDDTRIPTLGRFCDVLAGENPGLLHTRIAVGHGFDLFARSADKTPLRRAFSLVETLKAWRRFFLSRRVAD